MHGTLVVIENINSDEAYIPSIKEIMSAYGGSALFDYIIPIENNQDVYQSNLIAFFNYLEKYGQNVDEKEGCFTLSYKNLLTTISNQVSDYTTPFKAVEDTIRIIRETKFAFPCFEAGYGISESLVLHAIRTIGEGTVYKIKKLFDFHF
ncbi:MAG: hypothetical protein IAA97_00080 [Spirochaetes bacterium]|uniref:Uncharacterized protein n=1 Tax=Candidatus Ornithospirochaeta stercoripullorum TaxID=2840899 RepID=A0A9D9H4Z0_9SPIO|nr:hypothetical protein [Candidatus Ornithospirochaeta stercoripullorum]